MSDAGLLTPGEVAETLGVSAPTVRRLAVAYEAVFESMARGGRGGRLWNLETVRRFQVAHEALASGRVASLEAALTLIRDGEALPERSDLPTRPDHVGKLLNAVEALQAEVVQLRRELAARDERVGERLALPASGTAPEVLREVVREEIGAALDPERLWTALRVTAQHKAPQSFWGRLLAALRGRQS